MTVASFVDVCRFTPASSGTGDFVVSAAVTGYQTPASAGAVNGSTYHYRAESSDLTQWEVGQGTYTVSSTTLARTTILFSSTGSKVSFSAAPQVALVLLAEDLGALAVGQIPGTATNDNASSGNVGEYVSSTVLFASAVALTGGVGANVTSISLTAGDWDVSGNICFNSAATTNVSADIASISTTSATVDQSVAERFNTLPLPGAGTVLGNISISAPITDVRMSLSSTTTVYLVAYSTFTVSTNAAWGTIRARRIR